MLGKWIWKCLKASKMAFSTECSGVSRELLICFGESVSPLYLITAERWKDSMASWNRKVLRPAYRDKTSVPTASLWLLTNTFVLVLTDSFSLSISKCRIHWRVVWDIRALESLLFDMRLMHPIWDIQFLLVRMSVSFLKISTVYLFIGKP